MTAATRPFWWRPPNRPLLYGLLCGALCGLMPGPAWSQGPRPRTTATPAVLARLVRPTPGLRPLGAVLAELAAQSQGQFSYSSSRVPAGGWYRVPAGPPRPLAVALRAALADAKLSFGLFEGQLVLWPASASKPAGVTAFNGLPDPPGRAGGLRLGKAAGATAALGPVAAGPVAPAALAAPAAANPAAARQIARGRALGAEKNGLGGMSGRNEAGARPAPGALPPRQPRPGTAAVLAARTKTVLPLPDQRAASSGSRTTRRPLGGSSLAGLATQPTPRRTPATKQKPKNNPTTNLKTTEKTDPNSPTDRPTPPPPRPTAGATPPRPGATEPPTPTPPPRQTAAAPTRPDPATAPADTLGPNIPPPTAAVALPAPGVPQPPTPTPPAAPRPALAWLGQRALHGHAGTGETLHGSVEGTIGFERAYLLLGAGLAEGRPALSLGLGTAGRARGRFTPNLTATYWWVSPAGQRADREPPARLAQLRPALAWQLRPGSRLCLVGGPTLNLASEAPSPPGRGGPGPPDRNHLGQGQWLWLDTTDGPTRLRLWPGVQVGLRF